MLPSKYSFYQLNMLKILLNLMLIFLLNLHSVQILVAKGASLTVENANGYERHIIYVFRNCPRICVEKKPFN